MSTDTTINMTDDTQPNTSLASKLKGLWPFALILIGLAFAVSQGWHELLTLESIRENIGWLDTQIAANFLIVFVSYMLIYAAATAFMVPASFLTIAGGASFGFTFSITLLDYAAKTSLGKALRGIAGPFVNKMEDEYNQSPILYLIVLRLVPAVPFAVANIAPSLLGAKFRNYVPTTFFGIMPGTLAYSWIGASAAGVIRDPNVSTDNASAFIGNLVGQAVPALVMLFLVSLIPVIYKRFFQKTPSAQTTE